jgi:uncharacterized protein YoxC
MNTLQNSNIFFFISSIGFIIIGILICILLVYLIRTMSIFRRIVKKLEGNVDTISLSTKNLIEEIKDSNVFHFMFGKKGKKK